MSKRTIIVILGLIVAFSPFLGLPYSFLLWILPILGVVIAILAYPFRPFRSSSHDEASTSV